MGKVGFFGGCFNPPNTLHIEIANNLIKDVKLDKVVFVPVNDFYKKEGLIEAKHRYNMLKLALEKYNNLEADDIELKENRALYASDAFELITRSKFINKNDSIFLIMGSDNYKKMPNWKNYDIIKDKYKYIVIDRKNNSISSSKIRSMINNNPAFAKQYLPEEVYKYIIENKLYQK